jgi:hypothetical protein
MKRTNALSILVLVAILAGLLGIASPVFAAGPTVSTANTFATAGQTFTVNVNVDTSGSKLLGWGFDLAYDPAVLSLTSWAEGNFIHDQAVAAGGDSFRVAGTTNNTTGSLAGASVAALGFPAGQGATGTGTIATLTFLAKANGKANLVFSNTTMVDENNHETAYTFAGGFVRVGPAPALAIQSITFNPPSGVTAFGADVIVKNNGAAMAAGDETVFTLAMNKAAPASQTFNVSGLATNATQTLHVDYTMNAGETSSTLSVSDSVYGTSASQAYFSSIADIKNTNVDAKFNTFITLTTTGAIQFYPLSLGANTQTGAMNVNSNAQQWTVAAASTNGGQMAEWNGSAWVTTNGHKLHDQLVVSQAKRSLVSLTGASGSLIPDGKVENQTADAGEDYSLTYAQALHAYDAALSAPNTYHMVVTYTAAVGF